MSDIKDRQEIAQILRLAADGIESGGFFVEGFNAKIEMGPRENGKLYRCLSLEVSEFWLGKQDETAVIDTEREIM